MNQTRKETLAEREKKRREYLQKQTMLSMVHFVSVGILGTAGLAISGFGACLLAFVTHPTRMHTTGYAVLASMLVVGTVGGICGYWLRHLYQKSLYKLTYVPPVAEQIASLPDEAILVRGSDRPAASPEELLRAAHTGRIDAAQELLRGEEALSQQRKRS